MVPGSTGRRTQPGTISNASAREAKKKRTLKIIQLLKKAYPEAKCALAHRNPLELLIATILSAQCTDKRVNIVTQDLFRKYKTASDYASAKEETFQQEIRSTGFYKNKARNIIACAKELEKTHGGKVPKTMEELTKLSGVGRKTANVILGNAYGIAGLVVDTHVTRIANLLGLTRQKDPVKIEFDLMPIIPKREWTMFSHLLIQHGRACCVARRPDCTRCPINRHCPSSSV